MISFSRMFGSQCNVFLQLMNVFILFIRVQHQNLYLTSQVNSRLEVVLRKKPRKGKRFV